MSTALIVSALAGAVLGALIAGVVSAARQRSRESKLARRLEAALARIAGSKASSVFESVAGFEPAVDRLEEAIEELESSKATALENLATLRKALDEISMAVSVYNVSGEPVYENSFSKVILDHRYGSTDTRSLVDSYVAKALWNGEAISEELSINGDASRPLSIEIVPLDGDKKRLGAMVVLKEMPSAEQFSLIELCEEVGSEFEERARGRSINLSVYHPPAHISPGPIAGAVDALREAARALIENSLEAAPSGSAIEIGAARVSEETWLWVADEVTEENAGPAAGPHDHSQASDDFAFQRYVAGLFDAEFEAKEIAEKGRRFTFRFRD